MPIRSSVFIAVSLDGFIARTDGNLDWLIGASDNTTEDFGYADFMAGIDALVMGRSTFETALTFDAWPYDGKRVTVLSSRLRDTDFPASLVGQVEIHPGPVAALLRELETSGVTHLYVDGGKTIRSFLEAGHIDDITLTRIPVLIGSGIPLFGTLPRDIVLQHLKTTAFDNGFVQSHYRVLR